MAEFLYKNLKKKRKHTKQLKDEEIAGILESTNSVFTEEDLKEWYRKFRKENKSGAIGKKEIMKLFSERFRDGDPELAAENLLRVFDEDGSGKLDFRELMMALSLSKKGVDNSNKLRVAFSLIDSDSSGSIDKDELYQLIYTLHKLVGKSFAVSTTLEDTPEAHTDAIMSQFDEDGDDSITYDEFCRGVSRSPTIAHLLTAQLNPDMLCKGFTE